MNSVTNVTKLPRQPVETRKTYILEHIVTKTTEEIASDMGVTRQTIHRDIVKMKDSGEWHEWLELFLLKLYSSDDVSDDAKLRSVTMLYGKTLVQRTEVKTDGVTRFEFVVVKPDDEDTDGVEAPPDAVDSPPE